MLAMSAFVIFFCFLSCLMCLIAAVAVYIMLDDVGYVYDDYFG